MRRGLLYASYGFGAAIISWLWWQATGHTATPDLVGVNLALGHITGLLGAYLVLWQLVLLSRLPIFDTTIGLEHVTWLHRWNGYAALGLLLAHTLCLTIGYAAPEHITVLQQFLDFQTGWDDVLKATVGLGLLIAIVVMSVYIVRRRLKYETWYWVHVTSYLAIVLAFGHQLGSGADFLHQPGFRAVWIVLYVVAFGLMIIYRFGAPAYLWHRHRFRVDRIETEAPNVVSVYITGRNLQRLHYQPGQFFIWRFLDSQRWWQAHPFTVSVAPNGQYLRLTAKELGDFTRRLPGLRPGARVSLDGPHGYLTANRLKGPKVVMVAGGIGITPIRAMLEALPGRVRRVILIYAVRTPADLVFRAELEALAQQRHIQLHYVLSDTKQPGYEAGVVNQALLRRLAPDIAKRELVLCGPPAMMAAVSQAAQSLGVAKRRIYQERFAYVS